MYVCERGSVFNGGTSRLCLYTSTCVYVCDCVFATAGAFVRLRDCLGACMCGCVRLLPVTRVDVRVHVSVHVYICVSLCVCSRVCVSYSEEAGEEAEALHSCVIYSVSAWGGGQRG